LRYIRNLLKKVIIKMNFYEISVLVTLSGSFAVVCIYFYLFMQYRQRYIGLWIVSWLLHFVRLAFLTTPLPDFSIISLIFYQITNILSSLIMLVATNIFIGRNLSNYWYFGAIITIFLAASFALYLPFSLAIYPTCLYLGITHCWNGILFIRHLNVHGLGKYVTGISFIILGLHLMDMPFLITVVWFVPWGLLIDAVLRFGIAVGTLIVYFEKTRNDLLVKEQYYRLLAENASDVIYRYTFHPAKGFEYISPSVAKLTGYLPTDFYASPTLIYTVVHPSDHPILKLFLNEITLAEQLLTLRLIRRDHSLIWIEQKSVPLFDPEGHCIGFESIVRDITARKLLEQDVSRLDRLNTVGQMAASVAHEIRNPMTTVRGYLQFFLNKQEFMKYKSQFELLIGELDRTNSIIKEYLSLSRDRIAEFQPAMLNDIIEALYPLVKADANAANKDIVLCLQPLPELVLDEKEIRQLILNLVRNGLEAMQSGGTITIRTYLENEEAVLVIKDQGPGIPQHILDNLGKPFLTTKENGTGLGLAICYQIANRHQAKLQVDSKSSGTTFFIRFKLPSND